MNNILVRLILGLMLVVALSLSGTEIIAAPSAAEIMEQVDEYQHLQSAKIESKMIITKGPRKMVKEMTSYIKGADYGLTKFTNPRDRGSKFLKRENNLWMFFPDAEDIVKISGHMLEQGMMGSDFSYQDLMESTKLADLYQFTIIGEEKVDGRSCYVIEGIKEEGKEASYYRRKEWVDKERFVLWREELYARSGRLLKELQTKKVEQLEGRWYPMYQIIDNKLKKNSQTVYEIKKIEFDLELPANTFSLQRLR
ncbi:outer membrane lipoprotein-sorting protein [Halanaerobacter jeridensis]|uniref:Outer membrane lipoprotein-sorting protein n=1 Tax=Halanaerobacter jeridensis TaxID=706427 RepID=A0A938XUR9_9FIRM|nr:outer membrane lipoprotein-sorting protein [Halanaerobacter jeridensis]MBM7555932.1 outer membrane lipoprotein-sorting protein [Halanaerobacter jeridensis]